MIVLLLSLQASAAWSLGPADLLPLPEAPAGFVIAERADGTVIVATGPTETRVLALDGVELYALGSGGSALVLHDADGDGVADVVRCGDDGLSLALWPLGGGPETPFPLDPSPCRALVGHALAGTTGVLAVVGQDATIWYDGPTGLDAHEDAGLILPGEPRLSASGDRIAAASEGDGSLQEIGPFGVSSVAIGGELADVVAGPSDWLVGLGDLSVLRDLGGADTALSGAPGRLATGDFDGDGIADVVVTYPGLGTIEVRPGDGSAPRTASLPPGPGLLAVGDLDGDGCDDLAIPAPGGLAVLLVAECPVTSPDADGDGWTIGDGDCDDTSASIHPEAQELCDGFYDDDCDGAIDERGELSLDVPPQIPEGETVYARAAFDGCPPEDVTFVWTFAPDEPDTDEPDTDIPDTDVPDTDEPDLPTAPAVCEEAGDLATCVTEDDGALVFRLDAFDSEGEPIGTAEAIVAVRNLPPILILPADFEDGTLFLDAGEDYTETVSAEDVEADPVTLDLSGEPAFFTLSPNGALLIGNPRGGDWDVTIVAVDDEGGRTEATISLSVDPGGDTSSDTGDVQFASGCDDDGSGGDCGGDFGCGGGCCGGGGGMSALATFAFVWARRSRR